MKANEKIEREYIVTSEELKKKLGLKGNISVISLYEGYKEDEDLTTWCIESSERNEGGKE